MFLLHNHLHLLQCYHLMNHHLELYKKIHQYYQRKNKLFVFGLIPYASKVTVLLLINGTKATDITLLPKLCLTVCGTIVVLTPALVCTTSLLVVCTKLFPCHLRFDLGLPDH
jgi:hypothetical protein